MRRLLTILLLCICLLPSSAKAQSLQSAPEIPTVALEAPTQLPAMQESTLATEATVEPLRTILTNPCGNGCGYEYHSCTWWAAVFREQLGLPVPDNLGDAKHWATGSAAQGIPIGTVPQVGAVVVSTAGEWGHVMVIRAINPDGSFHVIEGNHNWDGTVDERDVVNDGSYTFVYE